MTDNPSHQEDLNELKFAREQGFFDKSLGIRWMIALVFMFCLFLFLHFREVRVEMLELDSIASRYIVAQIDFDFFDDEATVILKQDAVRDIGRVYEITENDIRQRRNEFENFLLYNQDWQKQENQSASFEQIRKAIDTLDHVLSSLRFTDTRTLQKIHEVGFPIENIEIFTPGDSLDGITLPDPILENIKQQFFPNTEFSPFVTSILFEYFKFKKWHFKEDVPTERALRKWIQSKVPKKYTHINAGNRIIDQGEKVTTRHIAMLQAMKSALGENRNLWSPITIIGSLFMTLLLTIICTVYLKTNYPNLLSSNRRLFLLITIILITMGLAKANEFLLLSSKNNLVDIVRFPLIVPFAAILIGSLINFGIATFASGFLTVLFMMALAFDNQGFVIINLAAAVVAILSTRTLYQRKEIFVVCCKALLCAIGVLLALHFYSNTIWSWPLFIDILISSLYMILTAVLVVGLLPLLESTFHVMTDVSLMEYMDPNTDLLRRFTIEAPGTYQHSVVVGNLAEAAALAIGANGLFCRVATLYHDIGKISISQYFTENQVGDVNIHQLLTPEESAQVIMSHVGEGVAVGRKAGLPEQIIDIIKEHHGTTLVYYFYRKQIEKMGGDKSLVNEKNFRYPGPKPRTKESVIIMIADSFEAASRSLEKLNEQTLTNLVNRVVREKAEDGQFDDSLLTFEELGIVKKVLVKTLLAAGHTRIKYPSRENPEESLADQIV